MLKVSVLTATSNQLQFVGQMMRSVLAQKYNNIEHIVIDDCSKDRTYKRALEIAEKHPHVHVYQNDQKKFCGGTYRRALKLATGDLCAVLDGDDQLLPHSVSTIVKYYEQYPNIDFIWTNHYWYNTLMTKHRNGISRAPKRGTIYRSEEGLRHIYSHWRTFRSHMRDRGTLFDKSLKCTVDKDLGYRLEELGQGAYLDKMLYNYRYHSTNMSHNSNQRQVWARVREKHKDRSRKFKIILL